MDNARVTVAVNMGEALAVQIELLRLQLSVAFFQKRHPMSVDASSVGLSKSAGSCLVSPLLKRRTCGRYSKKNKRTSGTQNNQT